MAKRLMDTVFGRRLPIAKSFLHHIDHHEFLGVESRIRMKLCDSRLHNRVRLVMQPLQAAQCGNGSLAPWITNSAVLHTARTGPRVWTRLVVVVIF